MDKTTTALFAFVIAGGLAFVSFYLFESGPLRFTINFLTTAAVAFIFSKVNQKMERKNAENDSPLIK